ncbi:hypothetical protein MKZ38_004840 [Zalerion maritima]|uniref:Uncharacterized protein n=1 Tax=Zalerion maritima TaxID=339359 RepID=A0AAD5WPM2_9PEZI|nr:hypothetical protein MKZ38_004840 [Zalerion maritima]
MESHCLHQDLKDENSEGLLAACEMQPVSSLHDAYTELTGLSDWMVSQKTSHRWHKWKERRQSRRDQLNSTSSAKSWESDGQHGSGLGSQPYGRRFLSSFNDNKEALSSSVSAALSLLTRLYPFYPKLDLALGIPAGLSDTSFDSKCRHFLTSESHCLHRCFERTWQRREIRPAFTDNFCQGSNGSISRCAHRRNSPRFWQQIVELRTFGGKCSIAASNAETTTDHQLHPKAISLFGKGEEPSGSRSSGYLVFPTSGLLPTGRGPGSVRVLWARSRSACLPLHIAVDDGFTRARPRTVLAPQAF